MPQPDLKKTVFDKYMFPSLTLKQIAGITPRHHFIKLIDERYENINFNEKFDLIGISITTYSALRGYRIADTFRKKGIPVVFGGYHASLLPEEAKKHADSVVIGEAENTWPQLLKDLESGKLKKFYYNKQVVKANEMPPARHDIGIYTPFIEAIQTSRGCPVGCEFCTMSIVEGNTFRGRPIDNVIKEMKSIKTKQIFFVDASLTTNPNYSKQLFKKMKEINKKFKCFGNINVFAHDDKFLQLASEAGVTRWYIGIESISQFNIDQVGKGTNKVKNYVKAIKNIKDHGMMVTGFFMFGFDNDTSNIFDKTLKFIKKLNLDSVAFSALTPFPGTRLAERLENEGRILSKDWSRYNEAIVNIKPRQMTEEELYDGINNLSREYFSYLNILKRNIQVLTTQDRFKLKHYIIRLIENLVTRSFYFNDKLRLQSSVFNQ
jgi:radical SAM superfamily enzyme YgiQ (UPF0313 family)